MPIYSFAFVEACNSLVMLTMWALYYSVVDVGSTFMHFQWDILLLEAGFLAVLVAPFRGSATKPNAKDNLAMWLVRWLLFRLMFASGLVKLQSNCPEWWGLSALNWHYESQCIPTPLSWFVHHLPNWAHQVAVLGTYFIEIAVPFLFFSPVRGHRIFAFYCQVSCLIFRSN
jgi:hypothetical protein